MAKFLRLFSSNKKKPFSVYWSSHKYLRGEDWDNFGDALVPFLIKRITNTDILWNKINSNDGKKVYIVIGSILELANKNNIVWGAGIIKSNAKIKSTTLLAVRGPISYSRVLASGLKMEKIWGDPALLLPFYFSAPKQVKSLKKLIIPHYVDFEAAEDYTFDSQKINIIDLKKDDIESIICKIAVANFVFSSSLHGLIVAHAYGIPAVWVKFTDKLDGDDIKFFDYFLSVGIRLYKPYQFSSNLFEMSFPDDIIKPDLEILNQVQINLLESCPFLK